jgi:hypothetical protein
MHQRRQQRASALLSSSAQASFLHFPTNAVLAARQYCCPIPDAQNSRGLALTTILLERASHSLAANVVNRPSLRG